jgi:predicted enzyme related to lactoylglutathione lyase
MKNIGAYFEIPVIDIDRSIKFYKFVFGFEFSRDTIHGNEMAFFPFHNGNPGITGALAKGEIYKPSVSGTLIYLNTENIEESIKKIQEIGGEILFPKTEVPNYGWVAEFKDSEGNRVALFQNT